MCTSGGDLIFYRLRAAFRGAGGISVRRELGIGMMGAAAAGWTLEKIGQTLAGGMSPVTVRTIHNPLDWRTSCVMHGETRLVNGCLMTPCLAG
jgi:hypothetical protein